MAESSPGPSRAGRVTSGISRAILAGGAKGSGLEELLSLVKALQTMQLGVTITDLAGTIVYVNPADAEMHGWSVEDLLGRDIGVYVPDAQRRPMDPEAIGAMQSWRRESVNVRRDGVRFPVRLLSDVVVDEDGRPVGIITTCEDITGRKAAESALAESRARLTAVLETTRDAIWSVDLEGRLTVFNTAFLGIWSGTLRRDLDVGDRVGDILAGEDGRAWDELHARALSGERFTVERSFGRAGRLHEVSFHPILAEGRVCGACAFANDVTDRRKAEDALRELQARYEAARGANDGLWDWDLVAHRIVFSRRFKEMLGYADDGREWLLEEWLDLSHPDDRDHLWVELAGLIDGKADQVEVEHRVAHQDGSWRWMLTRGVGVRDADARMVRVAGSQIDVTPRRSAEEALRESEQRYALAARGANDGLWDWDLAKETIYLSPRWRTMLGYAAEDVPGTLAGWLALVHAEDVERLRQELDQHLAGQSAQLESEYRMRHRDGSWRWMLCRGLAVRNFFGKATRMAGSHTDITDRKLAEEQLLRDAFHDVLTGLPNRALLMDRLGLALARARRRAGYLFAVLLVDLDRFKMVNESMGHAMGDQVLQEVATRVRPCVRAVDTLARLGGDEFALLLDGIEDVRDATGVAARILEELQQPFPVAGREVFMGASIGIAIGTAAYERPDELLRDADIAMYRAKSSGRGRHQIFDAQMHSHTVELLQMETDLRRALERRQLRLHYQPLVDLRDGRIRGFEALARWQHHEWGLVAPARFIPLAEETGIIVDLGLWLLREACQQLRTWQLSDIPGAAELHVSVNVSGRQLAVPELGAFVLAVLEETGLPPQRLGLEMTESVLMENVDGASAALTQIRAAGIHVHLDDFGTGYSSLSYLPRFPIDALKIDRSFVSRMLEHGADLEIVRTVVQLAHNLGKQVMAEGVETPEQLAMLRALRCDVAQGYLFAKPLDPEAMEAMLRSEPRW